MASSELADSLALEAEAGAADALAAALADVFAAALEVAAVLALVDALVEPEDDEFPQLAKPSTAANATAHAITMIDFLIPCPLSPVNTMRPLSPKPSSLTHRASIRLPRMRRYHVNIENDTIWGPPCTS